MIQDSPCLHQRFEYQVTVAPNAPALTYSGTTISYRELNTQANRLARYLQSLGVGHEQLVGLCLDRSLDTVVAILAVLKTGAAYVPMDPSNPAERVRMIVEDARCPVIVLHAAQQFRFSEDDTTLIVLDGPARPWETFPETNLEPVATSDSLVYVIYTSGSTGRPKGVQITHGNVGRLFTSITHWFSFRADDTWSLFHSFSFDFSVFEIWGALLHGGRVVVVPYLVSRSPGDFYRLLVEENVTQLCQTPSALRQLQTHEDTLAREQWEQLKLRNIILGGETLSFPSLKSWFERHGDTQLQIINMYGITETTIFVTYRKVLQEEAVPGTPSYIGVPIPDQPCYILNAEGQPVAVGEEGELYVGGAGNARGYFNRPDLTAERFIPSPFPEDNGAILYKSGDLVRRLDGDMIYIGRIDKQVQLRGFRVELGEIETNLQTCPGVQTSAVQPHYSDDEDLRLIAYYVADAAIPVETLRDHLARVLPDYMIPSAFMRIEKMPLTSNGKTDYRALPAPVFERTGGEYVAPRNDLEAALATLWQELLHIPQVGVDDNFFALGGHSLLATRMIVRIRNQFSVHIPLRAIVEAPTIAECALAINAAGAMDPELHALPSLCSVQKNHPTPLSFSQHQLWFLDQLAPGMTAYNCAFAIMLCENANATSIASCINEIIRRHDILRTTFEVELGEPIQRVHSHISIHIPIIALHHLPGNDSLAEAKRLIALDSNTPFCLSEGPLCRFVLYQLSERQFMLGAHFHHIIIDGWSVQVFLAELSSHYEALTTFGNFTRPMLPLQYADFTIWQLACDRSAAWAEHSAYWKKQLTEPSPEFELPTDYPRPPNQTYTGATIPLLLSKALTDSLHQLSLRFGVTITSTVMTIWKILFLRYARSDEVVVGVTNAARSEVELEGLMGFFINTLILRSDLSGNPAFGDALRRVHHAAIEAYEHVALPFEKVVAEVLPGRDTSRTPTIQVLFAGQYLDEEAIQVGSLIVSAEEIYNDSAKFDLTISFFDHKSGLRIALEYNTDLFRPSTVYQFLNTWETMARFVANNPDCPILQIPLLTQTEYDQFAREWNNTDRNHSTTKCLHDLFDEQSIRTPDLIALMDGDNELTYQEFRRRADIVAGHLRMHIDRPQTMVGICLDRSADMAIATLGTLKAGAVCVPLAADYPADRLSYIVSNSQIELLITKRNMPDGLMRHVPRTLFIEDMVAMPERSDRALCPLPHDNSTLAYVLYTSGSTGEPKGIAMPHRALVNLMLWQVENSQCGPVTRTLQFAPLSFDVSFQEMFSTWASGGTLVIAPEEVRRDPRALIEILQVQRIDRLFLPFIVLQHLAEMANATPSLGLQLREVITAGEQLRITDAIRRFFSALPTCTLINQYGPTESHVVSAHVLHGAIEDWPDLPPIGRPIANVSLSVLSDELELLPVGFQGELVIGGIALSHGYLNLPALTEERFFPIVLAGAKPHRIYKTGDLVRLLPTGDFEFLGRIDQQLKIRGYRVEPEEIEKVLNRHPSVAESLVTLAEQASPATETSDQQLIAYIVLQTGIDTDFFDSTILTDYLRGKLPSYMIPKFFVTIPVLPLTPSGKVDRANLPEPKRNCTQRAGSTGPESPVEERLVEIWSTVLGLENISTSESLFAIGGHSLIVVRIVTRIYEAFDIRIPVVAVFNHPTVRALARVIEDMILAEIEALTDEESEELASRLLK